MPEKDESSSIRNGCKRDGMHTFYRAYFVLLHKPSYRGERKFRGSKQTNGVLGLGGAPKYGPPIRFSMYAALKSEKDESWPYLAAYSV